MRCTIRGRPPVSTLYETVLFVTAVGSVLALALEWINRQRIAISVAAFLGMVGLFVANGYETLDKKDTMPSLVAVLDTNFWLSTHVTAITIGYSAGLLAALFANVYLLGKIFRRTPGPRPHDKSLARMVYGVLCFGMIFSTVGTILGGIWANESWGRFWGWDPKENGALLIVLTQIAILHGRLGGYLREHGLCLAAAFGGSVVAFSWWGVNLLGVGLHSYGFTSGIHSALWTYYTLQWSLVGLGGYAWLRERRARRSTENANVLPTETREKFA
jgi:ABC-type transport system involved in cytochrome c biogenesis permease subunit